MNTKQCPTTLLQDLRSLPGQYWILFSGTLVNRFGTFVMPFLVIYLKMHGYGPTVIGLTLSAYGAGAFFAGVIGGYLSDRLGCKKTMILSCGGGAAFMLVLSQASSPVELAIVTFMTGFFAGMYGPASGALIADLVPPELRVRAYSCQRWAINVGFASGMATAGFMANKSFMVLFLIDAGTTLVLGITLLIGLNPQPVTVIAKSGWSHALIHMKGNTAFQLVCAAAFLISVVFVQMGSSFSLQTTEGAKLDEQTFGMLMAINGILIAFLELPLTGFTRRFPPVRTIAVGYLLVGIGMGINILGASLPLLVISMVIFTLGEMIALPVNSSYMASLAPAEMRGRYQGVMSMTWSSAAMLAPPLGMMLYHFSPTVLWGLIMTAGFLATYLVLRSQGNIEFSACADDASSQSAESA